MLLLCDGVWCGDRRHADSVRCKQSGQRALCLYIVRRSSAARRPITHNNQLTDASIVRIHLLLCFCCFEFVQLSAPIHKHLRGKHVRVQAHCVALMLIHFEACSYFIVPRYPSLRSNVVVLGWECPPHVRLTPTSGEPSSCRRRAQFQSKPDAVYFQNILRLWRWAPSWPLPFALTSKSTPSVKSTFCLILKPFEQIILMTLFSANRGSNFECPVKVPS